MSDPRLIVTGKPSLAATLDMSLRKLARMHSDQRLLAADGKTGRAEFWLLDRVLAWCRAGMPSADEFRAIEGARK